MQPSAADPTSRSLGERIASVSPALTPTERRLARLIVDDPTTVAFGTVADLARTADTSGPSVVRFATKLGFDGYGGLQEHVQASLTEILRRPVDRLRLTPVAEAAPDPSATSDQAVNLVEQMTRAVTSLDGEALSELASVIARAPAAIWVLCAETSATPGTLLAGNLRLLRPGVRSFSGGPATVAAQLAEVTDDDVVIAIDFPRYESTIVAAAGELAAGGTTLIAITDGPFSPLATLADHWLGVDVATVGPFDSVLPVVAAVELLVAETARLSRREAKARLDRIEALWTTSGVFEPATPGGSP